MNKKIFAVFAITMLICCLGISAKNHVEPKIYIYGFAASFNDSVVYITDIQEVDSVWLQDKTDFLIDRDSYSHQFKEYLTEKKFERNRTAIVSFALKRKDIEKKYLKLKKVYTKNKDFDIRTVTKEEFQFVKVESGNTNEGEEELTKKEQRKEAKAKQKEAKAKQKEAKAKQKEMKAQQKEAQKNKKKE